MIERQQPVMVRLHHRDDLTRGQADLYFGQIDCPGMDKHLLGDRARLPTDTPEGRMSLLHGHHVSRP